jgi:hypothetical protein
LNTRSSSMITRIWHGRTRSTDADAYRKFLVDTGIADYTSTKGNLGAQVLERSEGEITHWWTISWWDSYESIRSFAGEEIEVAKYYEEDKTFLLEFEPHVIHCNTLDFRNDSR